MPTPVFLTVDTELAWRHHAAGLPLDDIFDRSIEPAGVGVGYHLDQLDRHGLKATFFVDPMVAVPYGLDVVRRIVDPILAAGQDIQLHLHANWANAVAGDRGAAYGRFELPEYSIPDQCALIDGALDLLVAAGVPAPVAFRAGSYGADDSTLAALAQAGILYDSSHNAAHHPWPSRIGLPAAQIGPCRHGGVIEVPVTVIEDLPGTWRPFQLCAMSVGEMAATLDHAAAQGHGAVTIVSHSFELATRDGLRPNPLHVRRFDALCELLAARRDILPTAAFGDRPQLLLDGDAAPLGPSYVRTNWRRAQQLWSNITAERAA